MRDDKVFLRHIRDEVNYITEVTKDIDYDSLMANGTLNRALLRSLEIIGEATKNISKEFKEKYPEIEWKKMAGLRDKLIHFYFGVDWDTVWDVITKEIPELKVRLEALLRE
ncbi:MAG: DUF86 domain-containing protein [bacterium]